MRKVTPVSRSRQVDPVRRDARNAARLLRGLAACGIPISWDGRRLRLHGRLPARTRHKVQRLGVHIVATIEALADHHQGLAQAPSASTAVN